MSIEVEKRKHTKMREVGEKEIEVITSSMI